MTLVLLGLGLVCLALAVDNGLTRRRLHRRCANCTLLRLNPREERRHGDRRAADRVTRRYLEENS